MTIYRTSDRYPQSDVHTIRPVAKRLAPRVGTSAIGVQPDKYQHLRKAAPVNRPLFGTLTWVASLPPDVKPIALVRDYARIANLVAAAWGDQKSFAGYMESLLTDQRGNRRGFPPDVLSELVALYRYHEAVKEAHLTWSTTSKRG